MSNVIRIEPEDWLTMLMLRTSIKYLKKERWNNPLFMSGIKKEEIIYNEYLDKYRSAA